MSTTRKVVIVAAVIVGICLLFLLMQNLTTEPSKAAATPPMLTCQPNHGKRPGCCHKTKAGNRKCDYPRRLSAARRKEDVELADPVLDEDPYLRPPAFERAAGCDNSTVRGKIETRVVGWDVMHAQLWQRFCWEKGHITEIGPLKKQMDVTTWGNAHGWREDGWRDGPDGWTDYGGKFHGGHYAVKTAKFKACVPFPTGCVDSNSATIRLSLLQHAGGIWSGSVGK